MEVIETIARLREVRGGLRGSVGLVPTMGYLHDGHLSLVRAARAANGHVVVSIFVNPAQFAPGEDFERYPRDSQRDLSLLKEAGVDYVFMPSAAEIYPPGFDTAVEVGAVAEPLEGAARPGHFRGVATVVLKLFNLVQPTRAYFGRKDAQQLTVIRRMVADLNLDVEVVARPTVREADGLAMSSRNAFLSTQEREAATVLWQALELAREMWTRGTRDAAQVRSRMRELIEDEELAKIDYISVADPATLEEVERIQGPVLVSLAVRIGKTRLIDNIVLGGSEG